MTRLPRTEFPEGRDGIVRESHTIGDRQRSRLMMDAIADGSRVARTAPFSVVGGTTA